MCVRSFVLGIPSARTGNVFFARLTAIVYTTTTTTTTTTVRACIIALENARRRDGRHIRRRVCLKDIVNDVR
ncbi:hypothetical protein OAV88_01440 [bacterium]|nr:hypothetical protein [bacterium]